MALSPVADVSQGVQHLEDTVHALNNPQCVQAATTLISHVKRNYVLGFKQRLANGNLVQESGDIVSIAICVEGVQEQLEELRDK